MSDKAKWSRREGCSELQRDDDFVFGTVTRFDGHPPAERWSAQEAQGDGECRCFPTRKEGEKWIEQRWLKGGRA